MATKKQIKNLMPSGFYLQQNFMQIRKYKPNSKFQVEIILITIYYSGAVSLSLHTIAHRKVVHLNIPRFLQLFDL